MAQTSVTQGKCSMVEKINDGDAIITDGIAKAGIGEHDNGKVNPQRSYFVNVNSEHSATQMDGPLGPSIQSNKQVFNANISEVSPCFVRGTRIATPDGEVPVENLRVGDLVLTKDNGPQPIGWIGSTVRAALGKLAPIRFRKGAVGNIRDLWVSPQHRMLLSGWQAELLFGATEVLAPAIGLINDKTITRVVGGEVEYFHILFDRHHIVFSDGAQSESFFVEGEAFKAMEDEARTEITLLFPEIDTVGLGTCLTARMCLNICEARVLVDYMSGTVQAFGDEIIETHAHQPIEST